MSQAPLYTPITDFSTDELNNAGGRSTVGTAKVDAEFTNISSSVNALRNNLELIQRDDGALRDDVVTLASLSPQVATLLGSSDPNVAERFSVGHVYLFPQYTEVINGSSDVSAAVQAALATGKSVVLNVPIINISSVFADAGQMVMGLGRGITKVIVSSGGQGFVFRGDQSGISHLTFVPPVNVSGVQSAHVADCVTIQGQFNAADPIEGFIYHAVDAENIRGAAIRMNSPLHNAEISNFRWHGMGNVATGVGAFHCFNPSNTNRSPRNITIRDGDVFRFGVPWINFLVEELGVTGRTEPLHSNIRIDNVSSRGHLLNSLAAPGPGFYPENCDHIYVRGIVGLDISVDFLGVHPNKAAANVDSYVPAGVNGSVSIASCTAAVGSTSPAIPANVGGAVPGGATGTYFRVRDCLNATFFDNDVVAGYFNQDFTVVKSGGLSSTLNSHFVANKTTSTVDVRYTASDNYLVLDSGVVLLSGGSRPTFSTRVSGGVESYAELFSDGDGSWTLSADPSAMSAASTLRLNVGTTIALLAGRNGATYLKCANTPGADVPNNSFFVNAATGGPAFKDGNGLVRNLAFVP